MIPASITRQHVLAAMARIDMEGVPTGRHGMKFEVRYLGHKYPPKFLISIAHKEAKGRPLGPLHFSGGNESNGFLKRLGFTVAKLPITISPTKATATIPSSEPQQKLR